MTPPVDACVSAGGREGHPAPEWEAGPVQEAGGALGPRTGEVSVRTRNALNALIWGGLSSKQKKEPNFF